MQNKPSKNFFKTLAADHEVTQLSSWRSKGRPLVQTRKCLASDRMSHPETTPVKSRFEDALKETEKKQEERISAIKNDPNRQLHYSEQSPKTPDSTSTPLQEFRSGVRGSLRGIWDVVLNATQMTSHAKLSKEKEKAGFHVTDGTGIVKNIVGEWEKFFVQNSSSLECVNQSIRAAQLLVKQLSLKNGPLPDLNMTRPQIFPIGSTQVYPLNALVDPASYIALEQIIKDDHGRPKILASGVYGLTDSAKPPIETTAVALIPEDGEGAVWVALTVNVAEGTPADDPAIYGIHKVGVFFANDKDAIDKSAETGSTGASRILTSKRILERELQIVADEAELLRQHAADVERHKKLAEEERRFAEATHKVEEMRKQKEEIERARHEAEEAALRMKNAASAAPTSPSSAQVPAFDANGDAVVSHADTYNTSERTPSTYEQTNPMTLSPKRDAANRKSLQATDGWSPSNSLLTVSSAQANNTHWPLGSIAPFSTTGYMLEYVASLGGKPATATTSTATAVPDVKVATAAAPTPAPAWAPKAEGDWAHSTSLLTVSSAQANNTHWPLGSVAPNSAAGYKLEYTSHEHK
jgi:hypothetical protein